MSMNGNPRKRQLESDDESDQYSSEIDGEEIEEETPEEKRLRLAEIYLEEIQRKGNASFCNSVHNLIFARLCFIIESNFSLSVKQSFIYPLGKSLLVCRIIMMNIFPSYFRRRSK